MKGFFLIFFFFFFFLDFHQSRILKIALGKLIKITEWAKFVRSEVKKKKKKKKEKKEKKSGICEDILFLSPVCS